MELSPRAVVAGRYRADQRLGSGAMGEVWAGTHVGIGIRVAMKRLLPAGNNHHESLARFKREAYLLGRIRSDYVARVLDFVDDKVFGLVLVMELVEGTPLYDLLNLRRFSVEETLEMGCDILNGLCDLHEAQIVHRDLKPGNIIVEQRSRGRTRCRLVDFGMSRVMASGDGEEEMTGITRADVALGTLEYMAPEQMLNSRGVTGAADVYAAGVILYRAVAGQHAYRAENEGLLVRAKLTQDAPEIDTGRDDSVAKGFQAIVTRAMKRKPQERYATADEMLRDLEILLDQVKHATMVEESTTNAYIPVEVSRSQPSGQLMAEEGMSGGSSGRPYQAASGEHSLPASLDQRSSGSLRGVQSPARESSGGGKSKVGVALTAGLVVVALGAGFAAGAFGTKGPAAPVAAVAPVAVSQVLPVASTAASARPAPAATGDDIETVTPAALPPARLPGPMPGAKASAAASGAPPPGASASAASRASAAASAPAPVAPAPASAAPAAPKPAPASNPLNELD